MTVKDCVDTMYKVIMNHRLEVYQIHSNHQKILWLRTIEAIKIKKSKSTMNLDRSLHLPLVWSPVFDLT